MGALYLIIDKGSIIYLENGHDDNMNHCATTGCTVTEENLWKQKGSRVYEDFIL